MNKAIQKIKLYLEETGMTQSELARAVGTSRQQIDNILRRGSTLSHGEVKRKINELCGINDDWSENVHP